MTQTLSEYVPEPRRVAYGVGMVALFALVVVSVAHAVPTVIGAEASYVVTSSSMSPTVESGDVIYVYRVDPANVEAGDIISFQSGTTGGEPQVTTHRVVEVKTEGNLRFVTRGDANENTDPAPVPASDVVGRVPQVLGVALHVPMLGHLLRFAGSQVGVVLLVFVPVGLLILNELYVLAREAGVDPVGSGDGSESGEANRAGDGEPTPSGVDSTDGGPTEGGGS